jgi:hypothetical protein
VKVVTVQLVLLSAVKVVTVQLVLLSAVKVVTVQLVLLSAVKVVTVQLVLLSVVKLVTAQLALLWAVKAGIVLPLIDLKVKAAALIVTNVSPIVHPDVGMIALNQKALVVGLLVGKNRRRIALPVTGVSALTVQAKEDLPLLVVQNALLLVHSLF